MLCANIYAQITKIIRIFMTEQSIAKVRLNKTLLSRGEAYAKERKAVESRERYFSDNRYFVHSIFFDTGIRCAVRTGAVVDMGRHGHCGDCSVSVVQNGQTLPAVLAYAHGRRAVCAVADYADSRGRRCGEGIF